MATKDNDGEAVDAAGQADEADTDFEDDFEEAAEPRYSATNRCLQLLQFLCIEKRSRMDIFEYLGDYYGVDEHTQEYLGRPSQRAGKMLARDLRLLRQAGYHVKVTQQDQTRYYGIASDGLHTFPRLSFDLQELEALTLLYTLFDDPARHMPPRTNIPLPPSSPQIPFQEHILALLDRLIETLPPKQKRDVEKWIRKPFVYLHLDVVTDYTPHKATIAKLIQAMVARRQVSFEYTSLQRRSGATPHTQVDPYYIIRQDEHLYLIGYSSDLYSVWKNQVFEFRIDRIVPESITQLNQPITIAHQQKPMAFSYWMDASLANSGPSKRWLSQEIVETADLPGQGKRVLVRAQAYNEFRIMRQLLKYGSKVEVVDPPALRAKMRIEIERLYDFYHKDNQGSI